MNFALKPSTIISHFLPGAFFLLAIAGMLEFQFGKGVSHVATLTGPVVALLGGAGFPAALIVGLVFDAVRHSLWETIFDWFDRMPWDVFARGDEKFLENLIESYYGYYVFDVNLMFSIIFTIIFVLIMGVELGGHRGWTLLVAVVVMVVLFFDAWGLRKEIARLAKEEMAKVEVTNAKQDAT